MGRFREQGFKLPANQEGKSQNQEDGRVVDFPASRGVMATTKGVVSKVGYCKRTPALGGAARAATAQQPRRTCRVQVCC